MVNKELLILEAKKELARREFFFYTLGNYKLNIGKRKNRNIYFLVFL